MGTLEQLMLPYESGPVHSREVSWSNYEIPSQPRSSMVRFLKNHLIGGEKKLALGTTSNIKSDDINKIVDANLRYALRFADSATSVGFVAVSETSSYADFVSIAATDNGLASQFIDATYSGIEAEGGDTFLDSLKQFNPID